MDSLEAPKKYLSFQQQLEMMNQALAAKKQAGGVALNPQRPVQKTGVSSSAKGKGTKRSAREEKEDEDEDADEDDEDGDDEDEDDEDGDDEDDVDEDDDDEDDDDEDDDDDDDEDDDDDNDDDDDDDDEGDTKGSQKKDQPVKKKRRKHAPAEVSSKKPVSVLRKVIEPSKKRARDPRFDDLSGKFSENQFQKNYDFINEYRSSEIAQLEQKMKESRNQGERERISRALSAMKQKDLSDKKANERKKTDMEWKTIQLQLAKKGKKPFYLKKSDQKKLELIDRYQDLKKAGKLEDFLEKKRRRNASREHKLIPRSRKEA